MRRTEFILLIMMLLSTSALGQNLSAEDKKVVELARSRYYNLESLGFQSATCSVIFDFSTIPSLSLEDTEAGFRLLKATRFTLNLDGKSPSVLYRYPNGTSEYAQERVARLTGVLESLVSGLFQTWPTKGLHGPIPAFDSQIESVIRTGEGYRFTLRVPGDPVQVEMSNDYTVTRIISIGGKIDERPVYLPTPDGLIFAGNHATDDSEQGGRVEVQYELENAIVDGVRLPSSAHLRVNRNIDLRFTLTNCSVEKGTVIFAKPPEASLK